MARYTPHRAPRRAWTVVETEQLAKLYPTMPTSLLAGIFGRDKSSITLKAKELKLKRSAEFSPLTKATGPRRKRQTKLRGTFSDLPAAAPNSEDAAAIMGAWTAMQARRYQNRAYARAPMPAEPCAIQTI